MQAPSSPFSAPAKLTKTKEDRPAAAPSAASIPSRPGDCVSAQLNVATISEQRKNGSSSTFLLAVLAALGATIYSGLNFQTKLAPIGVTGHSSLASISQWRASASEEWRLSPDAQRLDRTVDEAFAKPDISAVPQGMNAWREAAAKEWRHSEESRFLHNTHEPAPLRKWDSVGGLGAWREFAANRWRSDKASKELELTFEEAEVFSLELEPFSVSFFPRQKNPVPSF